MVTADKSGPFERRRVIMSTTRPSSQRSSKPFTKGTKLKGDSSSSGYSLSGMSLTGRPVSSQRSTSGRHRVPMLWGPSGSDHASTSSAHRLPHASRKAQHEDMASPVLSARPLYSGRKVDLANGQEKGKRDTVPSAPVNTFDHDPLRTHKIYTGGGPGLQFVPTVVSPPTRISPDQLTGDLKGMNSAPGSQHAGGRRLSVVDSDDFHSMLNAAATKIQRWYRAHRHRQHANVVRLLSQKRAELNQSITESQVRLVRLSQEKEKAGQEKQRWKAEKSQEARQAAIASLQRKREEKRLLAQQAAEEEFAQLGATGKVGVKPRVKLTSQKKHRKRDGVAQVLPSQTSPTQSPPTQGDAPLSVRQSKEDVEQGHEQPMQANAVDEIFQANNMHRPPPPLLSGEGGRTAVPDGRPTSSGRRVQGSRLADIMDALKILEEEPPPLPPPSRIERSTGMFTAPLSVSNLQSLDHQTTTGVHSEGGTATAVEGVLSDSKIRSILSYLDEVEVSSAVSMSRPAPRTTGGLSPSASTNSAVVDSEALQRLDAASAVAMDVTSTIQALRMELEDKKKTNEMLQKALSQQRERTVYHAQEQEKEGDRRLTIQKQEYEGTIKRHLGFIDQLIDDKKALSDKCEKLLSQMREMDEKYSMKLKTLTERHSIETERQRENLLNAERARREKWMQEQSKKIKEVTVKGLEPEIQRIIARHKAELSKVKALHEAELLQADERASHKFVQQMQELREELQAEREQACMRERDMARKQYEKAAAQEETAYQQQRRRLYAEVEEEKERLAVLSQQQRAELDQRTKELVESQSKAVSECKSEYERILSEQDRRHKAEVRDLQERLTIEKEAWEGNYMKKQEATLLAKERDLREKLRLERDKEIELVISRLEEETSAAKEECERAAENRIKRVRDKYEAELKEVERSEKNTLEKYNSMKEKLMGLESEMVDVRVVLRKKESEVEQISEVASKLTKERDSVTQVVRQEFADRLVATDEENKSLKIEMSENTARHKIELQQVQKKMEQEMEEVHQRVKQAISKKEEALGVLRAQHEAALKRAEHLEMLLDGQRRELLKK